MLLGAPTDLLIGAQRAALNEAEQTAACLALAAKYGASSTDLGVFPQAAVDDLHPLTLAELAHATLLDGGIDEAIGLVNIAREVAVNQAELVSF